jgi:hypothetical protein
MENSFKNNLCHVIARALSASPQKKAAILCAIRRSCFPLLKSPQMEEPKPRPVFVSLSNAAPRLTSDSWKIFPAVLPKNSNWADEVEDTLQRKALKKKRAHIAKLNRLQSYRLFVGGLNWGDLAGRPASGQLIARRRAQLLHLLKKFGEVCEFQFHWQKGYIHVNYASAEAADLALKTLEDFDNRKQLCAKLRKRQKLGSASLPPNFYVRAARPQETLELENGSKENNTSC